MARLCWAPTAESAERSAMGRYRSWVREVLGIPIGPTYEDLWRWSIEDIDAFWCSLWRFFELPDSGATVALATREMPGASWFPGVRLNYAAQMLAAGSAEPGRTAVIARSQTRGAWDLSWAELTAAVAAARSGLHRLGVGPGDRVAAYLPNIPETLIAFLATASLGALWSSCAPEFGTRAVIDRLGQIAPKVLFGVDGYRYGARLVDRRAQTGEISAAIGCETTVLVSYAFAPGHRGPGGSGHLLEWDDLLGGTPEPLEFAQVAFDHPLYVLYSSGTTGLPKAIVHGHGGILLEHLKALVLQLDLGRGDRFFWFTTTGWMMWNFLVSGLLCGAAIVCFDGDPSYPDPGALWQLVSSTATTYMGVSAPFLMACRKAGIVPSQLADLGRLRAIGATGAPLPAEGFDWVADNVERELPLGSISGGTDICTALVGSSPLVPVWSGEISCRWLGVAADAFGDDGESVAHGVQGELVVGQPLPSMPVGFWADPDGRRYRESYFERFGGVWAHGDWVTFTDRGSCIISGRSDATLNRGGVRLGTAEFYAVVEAVTGVVDSLIVHLEDRAGGPGELRLFVVLAPSMTLTNELRATIADELRGALSPRHVPDRIDQVEVIPKTLSGKKLEIPVKRILLGEPPDKVASRDSLADPTALSHFEGL